MKNKLLIGLIIILVLTTTLIGCAANEEINKPLNIDNPNSLSDEEAVVADLDQELISQDSNISIGDMV